MAQLAHDSGTGSRPRDAIAFAVVLIVIGVAALANQLLQPAVDVGGWVVLFIGLGLLAAFLYTRQYGFLIPGGIMTGLGAGIIASQTLTLATEEATGGLVVLGLGLGFLAIYAVGAVMRVEANHWWPVIPGGILTVVGGALLIGGQAVDLLEYWGVAVIAIGLFVLGRALMGQRAVR